MYHDWFRRFRRFKWLEVIILLVVLLWLIFSPELEYEPEVVVGLTIQPTDQVPTRLVAYTEQDWNGWKFGWGPCYANDDIYTVFEFNAGTKQKWGNGISFEWDIAYPMGLKQLVYDIEIENETGPANVNYHVMYVFTRTGGRTEFNTAKTSLTTNGTWTGLNQNYVGNGKVRVQHIWSETTSGTKYRVKFDQIVIQYNPILESHTLSRLRKGTQILEFLDWTCLAFDTNCTISYIPADYVLVSIYPNCSFIDSITTDGQLKLYNTFPTSYMITFKRKIGGRSLTDVVPVVLVLVVLLLFLAEAELMKSNLQSSKPASKIIKSFIK